MWLEVKYRARVAGGPHEREVLLVTHYHDGHQAFQSVSTVKADQQYNDGDYTAHYSIGVPGRWKPGRYWTSLYDDGVKAAEVSWTVTN